MRALLLLLLAATGTVGAQSAARRLTTVDALRQFSAYYHLQNVLMRGEFAENGTRVVLRGGGHEIRAVLENNVNATGGAVEVRAQLVDVGRLEPADPRGASSLDRRDSERWPRPGEELFVRVTSVTPAEAGIGTSVRALALEPWKFEGQTMTVAGNFRGRNLFGDLPNTPGKSRYDFVIRSAEGAIWVTGLRPRGRGFDLDVDRRLDTDRWLEVTGPLVHERGLVRIEATRITLAKAPVTSEPAEEDSAPPDPPQPTEVVFNSPNNGETDVPARSPVRVQFSRGLREASLATRIRVSYLRGTPANAGEAQASEIQFKTIFDAANRAIEIRFAQPLEAFRTVKVEFLEGITAFDGGPLKPWTFTFSVGG